MKWFLSILAVSSLLLATGLHVEYDEPVYAFLERMDNQGMLIGYIDDVRPLTRSQIAVRLSEIDQKRTELNDIDSDILDHYILRYDYELTGKKHHSILDGRNTYFALSSLGNLKDGIKNLVSYNPNIDDHHLIAYQDGNDLLWYDLDEMARYETKNGIGRVITRNTFRLSIQIGENLTMYGDANIYDQQVTPEFDEPAHEYKGGQYNVKERAGGYSSAAFDYSSAYIQYGSGLGNFIIGVEPLFWGPGKNSLLLSDNVDPFAFLAWNKSLGKSQISFFHGFIKPPNDGGISDETDERVFNKKYIVGHRWDLPVNEKLRLGFSEVLVYGGRDPEPSYFLPLLFFWSAQHSKTERSLDNILWQFEAEYRIRNQLKLYWVWMIDELSTSQMFKDSIHNMWGLQFGTLWSPKYSIGDLCNFDIRAEITMVHPWVYTHKVPVYSSYTHNGRSIGFPYGPNSQSILVASQFMFSRRQTVLVQFNQLKHGINELAETDPDYFNIGDDPNQNNEERDRSYDLKTKWLMGHIITSRQYSLEWVFQLTNVIELNIAVAQVNTDGKIDNYSSFQISFDY